MVLAGIILSGIAVLIYHGYFEIDESEAGRNPPWYLMTAIATVPSVLLTWYWRKKAKDSEINTNRFIQAIEQLGSDKRAVRFGGIYALEQIARSSKEDHGVIVETLSAFVRDKTREDEYEPDGVMAGKPATDEQAGLTVLGRLGGLPGIKIDLSKSHLEGANLSGAKLANANLFKAYLNRTDLSGADLSGANLNGTDLRMAILFGTRFDGKSEGITGILETELKSGEILSLGANLAGASYNKKTVFPESFDPKKNDMLYYNTG